MAKITQEELGDTGLELVLKNNLFTRWSETGRKFRLCNLTRSRNSKTAACLAALRAILPLRHCQLEIHHFPIHNVFSGSFNLFKDLIERFAYLGTTPYLPRLPEFQWAHNPLIEGSRPSGPTNQTNKGKGLHQIV